MREKRGSRLQNIVMVPSVLLCLVGVCGCALTNPQAKGGGQTWQSSLAMAEKDLRIPEAKAAFAARKRFNANFDSPALAQARTDFLAAVDQGQETIPPLYAQTHKDTEDDLSRLAVVYSVLIGAQGKAAVDAHYKGKDWLPVLKQMDTDGTKLMTLCEKAMGKDNPKLTSMRNALEHNRQKIAQIEGS